MKFADHVSPEQKKQLNKVKSPKKEEKVNWVEIMGMNRDTYKRHKGAVRRK